MNTLKILITPVVMILVVAVLTGCDNGSSVKPNVSEADLAKVQPADGATNVRLDQAVTITFPTPVDPAVAEAGFRLFRTQDMTDSMCTMHDSMEDHSGDGHTHDDHEGMMDIHSKIPAVTGTFTWNENKTRCTFTPDVWLQQGTQYHVHLDSDMMQMVHDRMADMHSGGNMHGSGNMHSSGNMHEGNMTMHGTMTHFTTLTPTGGGGGDHEEHHK